MAFLRFSAYAITQLSPFSTAYLQAVQATMILATILCCVGFFVFILQLFRLKQGERFVFTAIIQLLSGKSRPLMSRRLKKINQENHCPERHNLQKQWSAIFEFLV